MSPRTSSRVPSSRVPSRLPAGACALSLSSLLLLSHTASAETVQQEIDRLVTRVPTVGVIDLPASGSVALDPALSLSIDKLRNVVIDDTPPAIGPAPTYPWNLGDSAANGAEPYITPNIAPFRFNYFKNDWAYAGWYTWEMADYALAHGFNSAIGYANRTLASVPVAGSTLSGSYALNTATWLTNHSYSGVRFDQLPARSVLKSQMLTDNLFPTAPGVSSTMLDLEVPAVPLNTTNLRVQTWYPAGGVNAAFEDAYYNGFIELELAQVETAKAQGWPLVGIYGWQPFPRTWDIGTTVVNPATDWAWNRYGRAIYNGAVDEIFPSVYNFYWENRNVAYVLANIDLNLKLVDSEPVRKTVRPYFWNQLHGGGPGWRWWKGLPLRNEDMRAEAAMNFFTGDDGMTLWSWSDTVTPHIPVVAACRDYSVRTDFSATADVTGVARNLKRYDAITVLEVVAGVARFQVIDKSSNVGLSYGTDKPKLPPPLPDDGSTHRCWQSGDPTTFPVYSMDATTLAGLLRPATEAVKPLFEGLALARSLEYTLYTGTVKIDVSAQAQFANTAPVVRRVDNGNYKIIAAYDPQWEQFPGGRTVTLTNFDGHAGLTVQVFADKETRFYILRNP